MLSNKQAKAVNMDSLSLYQARFGTAVQDLETMQAKILAQNTVTALDGTTGKKACSTNGVSSIAGGTGIADMTLAAPTEGDVATIRINSRSSGSVIVTCATGVTVDGTNNTLTFDAVGESIVLAYKSATEWQIVLNIGAVGLSTV